MTERDLSPREARFCEEYVVDQVGSKAAVRAGYSEATAKQIACRLLKRPGVQKRIEQRQAERRNRVQISADDVIRQVREDHDKAVALGQMGPAVKSTENLGRHLGIFKEDRPQSQAEAMSDDELIKFIAKGMDMPVEEVRKKLRRADLKEVG